MSTQEARKRANDNLRKRRYGAGIRQFQEWVREDQRKSLRELKTTTSTGSAVELFDIVIAIANERPDVWDEYKRKAIGFSLSHEGLREDSEQG